MMLKLFLIVLSLALSYGRCFSQTHGSDQLNLAKQIGEWPAEKVRQSFALLMATNPDAALAIPCLPPVGYWEGNRITSGYGWRRHPIRNRQAHHAGIDIAGVHQYIRAAATGVVEHTGYDARLGYYVRVNHRNSYRTVYGHLDRVLVKAGASVQIGDKIGVLGRSGMATGLHLHYSVTKNGVHLDPAPYLTLALRLVDWYQQQNNKSVATPSH